MGGSCSPRESRERRVTERTDFYSVCPRPSVKQTSPTLLCLYFHRFRPSSHIECLFHSASRTSWMSHVVDGTTVITTDTLTDHHHCSIDREDRSWSACTRLWQFIESNLFFVHENDWTCGQVAKRASMWYTNFIAGLIGLIFIVGLPPWCSDAFNVETKHYAVYRNETRSMFGFAVSVYRDRYGRGWWVFIFPSLIFAYLWLLLHYNVLKLLCKNVIETKGFCVSIILIMQFCFFFLVPKLTIK